MMAFSHLIQVFHPLATIACATSAIREAENGVEIANELSAECGIPIKVIDGKTESEMISQNHLFPMADASIHYLYIDVGGGSTEISHFVNQAATVSQSFKVGTLRLINSWVDPHEWFRLKQLIRKAVIPNAKTVAIGTGGNISKALSLTGTKDPNKPVTIKKLEKLLDTLQKTSLNDRIIKIGLKPDRAEVIVPALEVYIKCMKWGGITQIYIPKVGLSDGLIHYLFQQHVAEHPIPFETTLD